MRKKRTAAVLLAFIMLLALAGCSGRSFYEALSDTLRDSGKGFDTGGTGGSDGERAGFFPDDVWRADADYSDMEYERCGPERLKPYTDAIYAFAENGGDAEAYEEADYRLWSELYYIYTMYVIASNRAYADAGNAELSREASLAMDDYYDAYDQFMLALKALALSEHSDLMAEYGTAFMRALRGFEPSSGQEDELTARENALISRYFTAVAAAEPDEEALGEIFVELVEVRNAKAAAAGYDTYARYAYELFYAKDYTPEDARAVWEGARDVIAPLVWSRAGEVVARAEALEADSSFDCSPNAVLDALGRGAAMLSDEVLEAYEYMTAHGLCDIGASPKKAEVGFTTFLNFYNEPFIFNAPYGNFYDYLDMMHEFGHFVNYFYFPSTLVYSMPDNDLSELQSQGMTVVMTYLFDELFGPARGDVMADEVLLELALSVIDGAMYDEFQQRVYSEPGLTPERVSEIYAGLYTDYGYSPYDGYENEWMYVSHNFESPFYYISYAVSALGALELNELCERDFDAGLEMYLKVLAMDPEAWYYSEAIEEAGFRDIFSAQTYEAAAKALGQALDA